MSDNKSLTVKQLSEASVKLAKALLYGPGTETFIQLLKENPEALEEARQSLVA